MGAPINSINSKFYSRIELIAANNRQIAALENQIAAHQEVSSITGEMIVNNADTIIITKQLISNNEKTIALKKEQIANNIDNINTIKELIDNNNKIIETNKGSIKFLQETQVLAKESRDLAETRLNNLKETQILAKESRDLNQQAIDCIEKMLAIMMKNPAKYGGLDKDQFQQLPEVMETKKNLTEIVAIKLNQYPKEERACLMDTATKVIDRSFDEINTYDLSFTKKIFSNLEKNIDAALAEQYTLMKDDYISNIRNYRIIQSLFHNFSSLSIKNFKI
jgi:hypothetical protein